MNKGKKAFTLAEVLMVLVIIGIISAMTIPTLQNDINEQKTVVKVKKAYATLQTAYTLSIAAGDPPIEWMKDENGNEYGQASASGATNIINHIGLYVKLDQNNGVAPGLLANTTTKLLDNTNWYPLDSWGNFAKARIVDGSVVVAWNHQGCRVALGSSEALKHICGNIYVDVDGKSGPNVMGKDIFGFFLTEQGFIPPGTTNDYFHTLNNSCDKDKKGNDANINGFGCTAWVLYKGNMDYLKRKVSWGE